MKEIISLLFFAAFTAAFSQTVYEPQVLILAPYEVKYDKSFQHEIDSLNAEIKAEIKPEELKAALERQEVKESPQNIKIAMKSTFDFLLNLNILKSVSLTTQQFLIYRVYEKFPNFMIILKDTSLSGNVAYLQALSKSSGLEYVINFPSIELYESNGIKFAKIKMQLYDDSSQSIVLEKSYIGDWSNPGFEFSCHDSSLQCTFNNALAVGIKDITDILYSNSPKIKRERKLQEDRYNILISQYYDLLFDKSSLESIISKSDSNIDINYAYQIVRNQDSSKFVAFFLQHVSDEESTAFSNRNHDRHINILTKDNNPKELLENKPQSYAYILVGTKENEKWVYEKTNVNYFPASTLEDDKKWFFNFLQRLNFFKEDSTELNPEFWNSEIFNFYEE